MTPQEHLLVMTMLAVQEARIYALVDILKSNGIIAGDDWEAAVNVIETDFTRKTVDFDTLTARYSKLGKALGLTVE